MTSPDRSSAYYTEFAAAFVRGRLPDAPRLSPEDLVRFGIRVGLRLHKFKRSNLLPRVRRVLGMLHGLLPEDLLDVGSGRGVFLWPLLPRIPRSARYRHRPRPPRRVDDLAAVAAGGVTTLRPTVGDVCRLEMPDQSVDGATVLEVLEQF